MTPGNIDTLLMIFGVLSFMGLGLIGLKIILGAWVKRKELAAEPDLTRITEAIDALRSESESFREHAAADIAELHERLDFTERMLARGPGKPDRLGAPDERTPA